MVDKKLLRLTEERMVEDGIGLDIVSLGKPPLHSVPLFRFKSSFPVAAATTSRSERRLSGNHAQFLQEKVPSSGGGGSSYPRSRLGTTPPSSQTSSSGAGGALRGSPPNYIRGTAALTASADIDTWDPLFYDRPPSASTTTADDTWFYAIPHWVDMSYHFDVDAYSANGFVPRCRMPGARQIAARSTSISAKCVPPLTFASGWPTAEEMDAYDSAIFVNHQSILGDGSHRSDRSNSPPLHMLASAATSAAATDFTTGGESSAVATPSTTPNSERLLSRSVPVALQMSRMGGSGAAIAASPPAAALRRVQRGFQASANAADTAVAEDNDTTSSSILRRRSSQITKLSTQRSALTRAVVASPSSGMAPNSPALSSPAQLYANRLIDPFRPGHNRLVRALSPHHVRRWHHVFLKKATMDTDEVLMKWRSLCTPACLPLTADYFPTQEELAELFQEYTYTISVNEEVTSYYGVGGNNNAAGGDNLSLEEVDRLRTQNLLLELISQRLVQGFQLLVGPPQQSTPPGSQQAAHLTPIGESVRLSSVSVTASPVYPSLPGSYVSHGPLHQLGFDANGSPTPFHSSPGSRRTYPASSAGLGKKLGPRGVTTATAPIYLSLGEQIHRLVYDPAAQNVEVKRYVRNLDFSAEPIHYACALWPKYVSSFVRRSATFSYPSTGSYNWNYLDQVVAGYQYGWRSAHVPFVLTSLTYVIDTASTYAIQQRRSH